MKKYIITGLSCILIASATFFIGRISAQKQYEKKIDDIINIYTGDSFGPDETNYDGLILSAENTDIADVY